MANTKGITRNAARARATVSPDLAYHAAERLPVHRLPFVGSYKSDISFWNIPATGGYGGGYETGAAMATAYLRHLKMNPEFQGGLLQHIVLDMCQAYKHGLTAAEEESLRGQIVGFCSVICATVQNTAPLFKYELNAVEETQLLKRANAGLAGVVNLGSRYA
jgi:hypothetical protein